MKVETAFVAATSGCKNKSSSWSSRVGEATIYLQLNNGMRTEETAVPTERPHRAAGKDEELTTPNNDGDHANS